MVSLSIKAPHIVCLKYILRGETGEAEHIQQNQLRFVVKEQIIIEGIIGLLRFLTSS